MTKGSGFVAQKLCTVCNVYPVVHQAGHTDDLCWPCRYDRLAGQLRVRDARTEPPETDRHVLLWLDGLWELDIWSGRDWRRTRIHSSRWEGLMESAEMSDYTPGPWSADGYKIYTKDWDSLIGHTGNSDVPEGEAVANARLIAAAPELLEALRQILSSGIEPDDPRIDFLRVQVDKLDWEAARAAIAKAEGR